MEDNAESYTIPLLSDGDDQPSSLITSLVKKSAFDQGQTLRTPEIIFVLEALQPGTDDSVETLLQHFLDQYSVDWEVIVQIAQRHQISSLLYGRLQGKVGNRVPPSVRDKLRSLHQETSIHNRYLTDEFATIRAEFNRHGIRTLLYKGPVLAKVGYGDIALRTFADLDILVPPDQLNEAASILADLEFAWEDAPLPQYTELIRGTSSVPPLTYEWKFERPEDQTLVELGWQFHTASAPLPVSFSTVWDRSTEIKIDDTPVRTLSPTDRLLVLAHHGTTHQWGELKWIRDIAAIANSTHLPSWGRVIRRAMDWNVSRRVRVALALSAALFGVPSEERVSNFVLQDEVALDLATDVIDRYLQNPLFTPSATSEFRFRVKSLDSGLDMCLAFTELFRPKMEDYRWYPLSPTLFPLYYLTRPARLGSVYCERLLDWFS